MPYLFDRNISYAKKLSRYNKALYSNSFYGYLHELFDIKNIFMPFPLQSCLLILFGWRLFEKVSYICSLRIHKLVVVVSGETSCASSTWAEWREWSNCTDSCGACGTRQRFRACNKAMPDCFCDGTAFEKEVCNQEVCRYPRNTACCTDYTPSSYNGRFICMKAASRV
ncbi:unnamed protein product [Heligmosomoides polygyrus]|uniref:TIL domain-containing protein n=1 Tax=Heligmosomoides polygyrus TaxID=6339 RepID=A0A183FXC7_HELPZ|nr:unnamed protein product [Heligmosomoides polygyrus]